MDDPSSCGTKNDEDVLSHVDHRKQQEVEDVEQLRDKRSYYNGKSTTTASQELDGNDQCLTIIKKLKNKYREVFEVGTELKPMKGHPVVLEVKDNVKVNPIHVCTSFIGLSNQFGDFSMDLKHALEP